LNKLLETGVGLAYHGMRAQNASFNVKLEQQYDPAIGEMMINPQALSRVIVNICNNAFYATEEKKKQAGSAYMPTLTFTTKDLGGKVEIKIRDNGTGIPPKVLGKIFNPFFSTKPTGAGTGLGLSISHDVIAQMHKGELKVNTAEGEFTEFVIILPKQ
jgi:signal transduction histidine kinase